MGRPRRPKLHRPKTSKSGDTRSAKRKPRERPTQSSPVVKAPPPISDSPPMEPSGAGPAESVMRILPLRTCLVSEGRSDVVGDRFWTRTYVTPTGREVKVKTVMEMETVECPLGQSQPTTSVSQK
jgi:hypothetical protein